MWTMPSRSPCKADEQTEFGDVLDLAFDLLSADTLAEDVPGIVLGLLEAQADATLSASTSRTSTSTSWLVETILPGCTFFLRPAHLGHVDQTFDARLPVPRRRRSR